MGKVGLNPPITENVHEWAAARGMPSERVLLPSTFQRRPPQTVEPQAHPEYSTRLSANLRGRFLSTLSGAALHGRNGLVSLADGSFAAESVYGRTYVTPEAAYLRRRAKPEVNKQGAYFSLVVSWSAGGNYYHWIHDTLTRLHGVLERLPDDVAFIVPSGLSTFQLESLAALGVTPNRLVPFSGDEDWRLETLYFAPATTNSGSDRAEVDEWLRDRILTGLHIRPAGGQRRIYLSRRAASSRRVTNENEVERLLGGYGFETCVAESLTFRDQVELFSQASVVVSTHGAGLTNSLFSPPGTTVVDVIQEQMLMNAYLFWCMSEQLRHPYWYFEADSVPRAGYAADTHVSLAKLSATLGQIGL